jgi:UDP-N-acetylmuramoyl-L-alanyl-D-glutamate--2,6-diaminopimelate ligase
MQTIVMRLKDMLNRLEVLDIKGNPEREISGLQYDSRKVKAGEAFVAIKGFDQDGHQYISNAHASGARVFFVEDVVDVTDATVVRVENSRKVLPKISQIFYNYPDQNLKLIGITGTNGKTTVASILHSIFEEAKIKTGLLTTVESFDGFEWKAADRTTPESLDLYKSFYSMSQAKCKNAIMEVSSHALSLSRVDCIRFTSTVFTNLGRDHLDFHHSVEDYFLAKRKLFENLDREQIVVLNDDDPYSIRIKEITDGKIYSFSLNRPIGTVYCKEYNIDQQGMNIKIHTPVGELKIKTSLLGEFNIYNILAAVTVALAHEVDVRYVTQGIEKQKRIKGRCETYRSPTGFMVYLDYAHTPDALRKFLHAVLQTQPRQLIVVFGAGGDRDKGKRPLMGQAAENYADRIILTNDNPRFEEPAQIINDILGGITDKSKTLIIPDRQDAIQIALGMAVEGDIVVIAGKGHETYQEIAGNRIELDDRQEIRSFFKIQNWDFPD